MRYIYRKIKKIQQNLPSQELTLKEKNILSQYLIFLWRFLDEKDKDYKTHKKFIEGSKSSFIQALQEQEENKKKLRKSWIHWFSHIFKWNSALYLIKLSILILYDELPNPKQKVFI